MFHGLAYQTELQQTGPRGNESSFRAIGLWGRSSILWGPAALCFGRGSVWSRQQFTHRRYPELFQTGETAFGQPIVDAQHPHDFIMKLGVQYARPLGERSVCNVDIAPVGDPTLGPVAFPHRVSASELPQATLGHHIQDSTHIANEVITVGLQHGMMRIEASGFHGAEPNENRWNIDHGAMDSWSGRLTLRPSDHWSGQLSVGRLTRPEALEEGDIVRSTASLTYHKPWDTGHWARAFSPLVYSSL